MDPSNRIRSNDKSKFVSNHVPPYNPQQQQQQKFEHNLPLIPQQQNHTPYYHPHQQSDFSSPLGSHQQNKVVFNQYDPSLSTLNSTQSPQSQHHQPYGNHVTQPEMSAYSSSTNSANPPLQNHQSQ